MVVSSLEARVLTGKTMKSLSLPLSIFLVFSSSVQVFETLAKGWRREGTSGDDLPRSW